MYKQIKLIPTKLIKYKITIYFMSSKKKILKRVVNGKSFKLIDFQAFDNHESEHDSSDDSQQSNVSITNAPKKFTIQIFGINEKGETACLYINNYLPFFYVKVGNNWTNNDAQELLSSLRFKVGKTKTLQQSICKAELVEHHKLYGFSAGNTHSFVKLTFKNISTMNKTKGLWYRYLTAAEKKRNPNANYRTFQGFSFKKTDLELYESNIPPLLRYFHINNISPSGWIFVNTDKASIPENFTTTCKYEYCCKTIHIKPLPDKETIVPYKICSFDIEASSSHGDFPVPVKTYKRVATNIVDVFMRMKLGSSLTESQAKKIN